MMNCSDESTAVPACRASIIIPSYNRRHDLLECLGSLDPELLSRHNVEVIVVDDASSDDTVAAVRRSYPQVRILSNTENRGPAFSRNTAARAARGRLLLFLDSDGVVTDPWLPEMLAHDDGKTVLLGCAVDYTGGRVQRLPRRATFIGKSLHCRSNRANTGPSCNLGVPRYCFEAIQGFDEEIPHYFEDSDFCIRARRAGFRFQYLPRAVFRHKGDDVMRGDAIRKQEHNSTYAMLKAYRNSPVRRAAFTLANGLWLAVRLAMWGVHGRIDDCRRLWTGWTSAHQRFRRSKSL